MFKATITETPLVNNAANDFFQNINGDSFKTDVTFVSTLRALVAPRMKPDERLTLRFAGSVYTTDQVGATSVDVVRRAICSSFRYDAVGQIYIHNFGSDTQEDNYACLEVIKSSFCQSYEGWHRLEKVTDFYRKQFYVLCFINPELKSVAIFMDRMDIRKMHYLQCSIFAFLPWYFDPKEGVSDLEMSLINSLREKTSHKYEETLGKIAKRYDFRTTRIRELLAGFETKYEKAECKVLRDRIASIVLNINTLNSQIGENLARKNDYEIKLLGLETKIATSSSEDSEIMEYFLCNDRIELFSVSDTSILFGVKSYLTYFDEEMVQNMINNENSYIYCPDGIRRSHYIPAESMKKLMQAIFIDQRLRIKSCAAYELNINGSVRPRQYYPFDYNYKGCLPNIHIDRFSCLGNYQRTINELLIKRDYIGAIEQCVASSQSLNFGDGTVINTFMLALYGIDRDYGRRNNCIELPDGSVVRPTEAIKWLEEQEGIGNE